MSGEYECVYAECGEYGEATNVTLDDERVPGRAFLAYLCPAHHAEFFVPTEEDA